LGLQYIFKGAKFILRCTFLRFSFEWTFLLPTCISGEEDDAGDDGAVRTGESGHVKCPCVSSNLVNESSGLLLFSSRRQQRGHPESFGSNWSKACAYQI